MRLQNEDEEYNGLSMRMPTIILCASIAIFGVLAVVLLANKSDRRPSSYTGAAVTEELDAATEEKPDTLRADDLNFWDMYSDGSIVDPDDPIDETSSRKDQLEEREAQMRRAEEEAAEAAAKEAEENADPATDGKHTLVTHIDGTTEWIAINSSLKLNTYEDTQFQSQNGVMGYYVNGRRATKTGVDISQYTTSIDWKQLTTEADFVMIRVGARGYDTGKIIADTAFIDNVKGAASAGIPFGVYFSSQAINETEAKEEATYVMTQLAAAQSAIEGLGLTASQTGAQTQTTQNNTSQTATAQNDANLTSVQQKLKSMGMEIDPSKYNTTTSVKDNNGNTTTTEVDGKGNTTVTVTDTNGHVTSKKTVNLDPYGNVTTVTTDSEGKETVVTELVEGAAVSGTGTTAVSNLPTTYNGPVFKLAYPVAVEMHMISNDVSRIEGINRTMRTTVLGTFCSTIETGGYEAMVSADKEFLLCQLNLAPLTKYEIWVANEGDLPDYPYTMSMWKYNTRGKLMKSLSGDYGVSVGFIDYSAR